MTNSNDRRPERTVSDESRRTFLEKGVAVTAGASAAASGVTSAQGYDEVRPGPLEGAWEALIFQNDFHPEARFAIVSDTIDWSPNYGGIDDSWFTDYNTRMIRWLNTGERVQLFIADEAAIGQYDVSLGYVPNLKEGSDRPLVYEVSPEWSPFDTDPRLTTINFSPVEEEIEKQLLEGDDWWRNQQDVIPEDESTGGNATDDNSTESTPSTRSITSNSASAPSSSSNRPNSVRSYSGSSTVGSTRRGIRSVTTPATRR